MDKEVSELIRKRISHPKYFGLLVFESFDRAKAFLRKIVEPEKDYILTAMPLSLRLEGGGRILCYKNNSRLTQNISGLNVVDTFILGARLDIDTSLYIESRKRSEVFKDFYHYREE